VASHDVPDGGQPGGTITMAFTDIEGSTRLLQDLGDGYAAVLSEHHRLLRDAIAVHGGVERGSAGTASTSSSRRRAARSSRSSRANWRSAPTPGPKGSRSGIG